MRTVATALIVLVLASGTLSAGTPRAEHRHGGAAAETPPDQDSGAGWIGRPAPRWTFTRWVGEPLDQDRLRGKVVLLRWWTDGCRFCRATLPAIERLRRAHGGDGLVVIGVYHPKPPRDVDDPHITALARRLGFRGALALDRDWETLNRYWLEGHDERSWTSVSFLIDREGRIRWVHGGGEYHPAGDPAHARCDAQFRELETVLATVLAEGAPAGASR